MATVKPVTVLFLSVAILPTTAFAVEPSAADRLRSIENEASAVLSGGLPSTAAESDVPDPEVYEDNPTFIALRSIEEPMTNVRPRTKPAQKKKIFDMALGAALYLLLAFGGVFALHNMNRQAPAVSRAAPAATLEALEESFSAPEESGDMPEESPAAPEESLEAPAATREALEESFSAPEESGDMPEEFPAAPEESPEAPAAAPEAPLEDFGDFRLTTEVTMYV
ncbi:dense granule protein GRA11 [Besnoitia besnoiti]|uniref:Dense granule protein GRA11 n=1 Tax=Besnoitia besnoiti TaxID=94643 RepID=A0A2A9MQP5_BESBE|nr:dense granule protein GRA11 [Besnoitia besnoiti]PFH38430.1 dense granule protein GRA11 [Besnoitia besnoiti]